MGSKNGKFYFGKRVRPSVMVANSSVFGDSFRAEWKLSLGMHNFRKAERETLRVRPASDSKLRLSRQRPDGSRKNCVKYDSAVSRALPLGHPVRRAERRRKRKAPISTVASVKNPVKVSFLPPPIFPGYSGPYRVMYHCQENGHWHHPQCEFKVTSEPSYHWDDRCAVSRKFRAEKEKRELRDGVYVRRGKNRRERRKNWILDLVSRQILPHEKNKRKLKEVISAIAVAVRSHINPSTPWMRQYWAKKAKRSREDKSVHVWNKEARFGRTGVLRPGMAVTVQRDNVTTFHRAVAYPQTRVHKGAFSILGY